MTPQAAQMALDALRLLQEQNGTLYRRKSAPAIPLTSADELQALILHWAKWFEQELA